MRLPEHLKRVVATEIIAWHRVHAKLSGKDDFDRFLAASGLRSLIPIYDAIRADAGAPEVGLRFHSFPPVGYGRLWDSGRTVFRDLGAVAAELASAHGSDGVFYLPWFRLVISSRNVREAIVQGCHYLHAHSWLPWRLVPAGAEEWLVRLEDAPHEHDDEGFFAAAEEACEWIALLPHLADPVEARVVLPRRSFARWGAGLAPLQREIGALGVELCAGEMRHGATASAAVILPRGYLDQPCRLWKEGAEQARSEHASMRAYLDVVLDYGHEVAETAMLLRDNPRLPAEEAAARYGLSDRTVLSRMLPEIEAANTSSLVYLRNLSHAARRWEGLSAGAARERASRRFGMRTRTKVRSKLYRDADPLVRFFFSSNCTRQRVVF